MNLLIIGDHPETIGGVTNYTRPLALELSKHMNVFYLNSSARTFNLDFGQTRIVEQFPFPEFRSFELVNSPGLETNYDNLDVDTSNWINDLFEDFILRYHIDIVHIHEIFGFSSSIIQVARRLKIRIVITIHEYWWLCPHRVMVDFNNKICEGPDSIKKCSLCVSEKLNGFNSGSIKFRSKLKNKLPRLHKFLSGTKQLIESSDSSIDQPDSLDYGNSSYEDYNNKKIENDLKNRLRNNIDALNSSDLIIGVSEDVKRILCKYGVNGNRIIVHHIGSTIAGQNIEHDKPLEKDNIVFGYIGGVGYYKGIHQLVEAYASMPKEFINKSTLKLFGKYAPSYYHAIFDKYLKGKPYEKNITFFGRYNPQEIPVITNQIDIMILPSLCADTAPQTIFESYSANLPIIAPNIGGFPDFIKNGITGLLYKKASVQDLQRVLIQVIKNPGLIEKMRRNIPKLKTIEKNAEELNEIYHSI